LEFGDKDRRSLEEEEAETLTERKLEVAKRVGTGEVVPEVLFGQFVGSEGAGKTLMIGRCSKRIIKTETLACE